jgi:hypothetical protein
MMEVLVSDRMAPAAPHNQALVRMEVVVMELSTYRFWSKLPTQAHSSIIMPSTLLRAQSLFITARLSIALPVEIFQVPST